MQLAPVSLDRVVEQLLTQFSGRITEAGGRISVASPLPAVQGHATTLGQVFANLLSNALKFVRHDVPPEITVRAEIRDGWVRVWMEDKGIGIDAGDTERIFRVFERAASEYPGTGVGLATVRRAVERMGGAVGVESVPGVGSRFWIDLPAAVTDMPK
jgi:signal transduction histidine kinase